jgi:hypothetical protein
MHGFRDSCVLLGEFEDPEAGDSHRNQQKPTDFQVMANVTQTTNPSACIHWRRLSFERDSHIKTITSVLIPIRDNQPLSSATFTTFRVQAHSCPIFEH